VALKFVPRRKVVLAGLTESACASHVWSEIRAMAGSVAGSCLRCTSVHSRQGARARDGPCGLVAHALDAGSSGVATLSLGWLCDDGGRTEGGCATMEAVRRHGIDAASAHSSARRLCAQLRAPQPAPTKSSAPTLAGGRCRRRETTRLCLDTSLTRACGPRRAVESRNAKPPSCQQERRRAGSIVTSAATRAHIVRVSRQGRSALPARHRGYVVHS
jgi:hypothetical protein